MLAFYMEARESFRRSFPRLHESFHERFRGSFHGSFRGSVQYLEDTKASTIVTSTGDSTTASVEVTSTKSLMEAFIEVMDAFAEVMEAFTQETSTEAFMQGRNGNFRESYGSFHGSNFHESFY